MVSMKSLLYFSLGILTGSSAVAFIFSLKGENVFYAPEAISISPREINIGGNIKSTLQTVIPPSNNSLQNTQIHYLGDSSKDEKNDILAVSETSPLWVIHATASLKGATAVWSAGPIIVDSNRSVSNAELSISKTLLFTALCNSTRKDLPRFEEHLSQEQESELIEALRLWSLSIHHDSKNPNGCTIIGPVYGLTAVRLEIASFFNKLNFHKNWEQK